MGGGALSACMWGPGATTYARVPAAVSLFPESHECNEFRDEALP